MIQQRGGERVSNLFNELQPQLVRILSSNLRAPDWVIDDACQTAWSSLLTHQPALGPGGELGWLSTTATRAALRLLHGEPVVEPDPEPAAPVVLADFRAAAPGPEQSFELRERLAEISRLPPRQRRVIMLHGFGYEYHEIAAATGDSRRTVARQLTRARQHLARLAEEA
ncbi:MAG: sigma-70 family RNA polymerase sigma factor [Acidobacteriota bacterium]|nr:sigma-70 family RNA polymerase sigma factor [Acidobacteriota bacterium]